MDMEDNTPQYARVEQPFGEEPVIIHCPVCGQSMIENPHEGVSPCQHTLFIYVGMARDFEYQSEQFRQRVAAMKPEDIDFDFEEFKDTLVKLGYDNKMLALEITYGGMACGPVWYTDVYGFSFDKPDAPNF